MNEEIKFRAYDTIHKKMYYVGRIDFDNSIISMKNWLNYSNSILNFKTTILLQYTRLKDKNNVEIYVGDIGYLKDSKFLMEVSYSDVDGCYKLQSIKHKGHSLLFCDFDKSDFEIVGNIYENNDS